MTPRRAASRTGLGLTTALALATALLSYGCAETTTTEGPVVPKRSSDDVLSAGQVTTSIWRAQGQEFVYLGTMTAPVEVTGSGLNVITDAGRTTLTRPADPSTLAHGDTIVPFSGANGGALLQLLAAARGSDKRLRVKLGGETMTQQLADGRELRMEFGPRESGHPPRVQALYLDDRLQALSTFTYRQAGSAWTIARTEAIHFDSAGDIPSVIRQDFKDVVIARPPE
jgi:hypothetical protein